MITATWLFDRKTSAGSEFRRHTQTGRRISKAQRGEFFDQYSRALHILVGFARRNISHAFLFRHRSIAGSTLYFRRIFARKPSWPHVQRRVQNSDAILHSLSRCLDLCLLSISKKPPLFFDSASESLSREHHADPKLLATNPISSAHAQGRTRAETMVAGKPPGDQSAATAAFARASAARQEGEKIRAAAGKVLASKDHWRQGK